MEDLLKWFQGSRPGAEVAVGREAVSSAGQGGSSNSDFLPGQVCQVIEALLRGT